MDFKNPYAVIEPPEDKLRTTFVCTWSDKQKLLKYEPKDGVVQITLAILLKKLINELEQHVQPGDIFAYHAAVCGATISLGGVGQRSTVTKPTPRGKRAKS